MSKALASMPSISFPRENNLEWLRLAFAVQVVLVHAAEHLGAAVPGLALIRHFPGVPAFFFVSGFLIYAAYLNTPDHRYFQNRFLRLYPGLVVVTLGGAAVALIAHGWFDLLSKFSTYATWFLAQTTLGQAYNPGHFRDIGVGVINGSLWTLTTEILFYLCVPALVGLERRFRYAVLLLSCISFGIYALGPTIWQNAVYRDKTAYDFIALTPLAWGWMFGAGILAVKHFSTVRRSMKFLPLAILPLAALVFVGAGPFFGSAGNRLGLVYFALYVAVVLWCAFGTPFLRFNFDLSFGAYVWHMPVINLLLVLAVPSLPLALFLTFSIAALSWLLVERPALRLKRRSLKPVTKAEPVVVRQRATR